MKWVQLRFPWGFGDDPVPLPVTTGHGSLRAYNFYGCRCPECDARRRSYDREQWELKNRTKEYREKRGKS